MRMKTPDRASERGLIAWLLVLFALTGLGALPLFLYRLDVSQFLGTSQLAPSSPPPVLAVVGIGLTAVAPTLAALLVAALFPGAGGVGALLRQVLRWRAGIGWYGLALVGPVVLKLLADGVHVALGGRPPQQWLALPSGVVLAFTLVGSLLAEEVGWRGFALPRLQSRYSALGASVIIGIIWSMWHLWPVIAPGGPRLFTPGDYVDTFVRLIATSIIYAWMYNSTRGSLFLVMMAHAGYNLANTLVPTPADGMQQVSIIIAVLYLAAALVVVRVAGARTLSRAQSEGASSPHSPRAS